MILTVNLDELEADALENYCHKISFFEIIKNSTSTEQARCINDALVKIETSLLESKK